MVEKVKGYDKQGKVVFERNAREYDKSIGQNILGISIGDLIKAVPIMIACGIFYANDINFKSTQQTLNKQMIASIDGINITLMNLNNYLSATTGKQFRDGIPR